MGLTVKDVIELLRQAPSDAPVWVQAYDEHVKADSVVVWVLDETGYPTDADGMRRFDRPCVVIR